MTIAVLKAVLLAQLQALQSVPNDKEHEDEFEKRREFCKHIKEAIKLAEELPSITAVPLQND